MKLTSLRLGLATVGLFAAALTSPLLLPSSVIEAEWASRTPQSEIPAKAAYTCQTVTDDPAAYNKVYNELAAQSADPIRQDELANASLYLTSEVLLPRAFPETLHLSFDRDAGWVRATYKQLATRRDDGDVDLLTQLLFRLGAEDPFEDTPWVDDFSDAVQKIPEVKDFRKRLEAKAKLEAADFEKLADAIIVYLQNLKVEPLVTVHFDEPARKWSWGDAKVDARADAKMLRDEYGAYILMRTGNYGVIKVQTGRSQGLLGAHPAQCQIENDR